MVIDDGRIERRVALITGGGQGIGRADYMTGQAGLIDGGLVYR